MPSKTSSYFYVLYSREVSLREDIHQCNLLLQDTLTKLMLILIDTPTPLLFFFLSSLGHPDLFCLVCFTFVLNVGLKAVVKNMHAMSLSTVISPTVEVQSI